MAPLVLDSGALIAVEREDRRVWTAIKAADDLIIPALVVVQCWRSAKQVQLARLIKSANVVATDLAHARRAGEICGTCGVTDVVDAIVAVVASDARADVATSDPDDLVVLLRAAGGTGRILRV